MADAMVDNSDSGRVGTPAVHAGALPPGTVLGKYRVDEVLGVGGMAITYRGFDTMLARPVAIKQIASALASNPKWCEHFRREAQTIARLTDARNVVRIYELVATKEGGLFLILEYVDGRSLEELIEENRLGVQASLEIIWSVALGLRSIHAKGIVHRDIKPANVLVPANRKAKIVDFGISGQWGSRSSAGVGTTRYMAPELFRGESTDGRCDVYSLGILGFEMLVGRKRFNQYFADILRDTAAQPVRWMNWHTKMDAELPRADRLNPEVPPLVADVIARMSAKSLNDRYGSAEELVNDLKTKFAVPRGTLAALASGTLALPADATGLRRPEEPPEVRRKRRLRKLLGGAVLALMIAAGLSAYAVQYVLSRNAIAAEHGTLAQVAFEQALKPDGGEADFSEAVRQWTIVLDADGRGRTEAGREALRTMPVAKAYLAIARKDWDRADEHLFEAESREAPLYLVRAARQRLERNRRIDAAIGRIDAALAEGKFELADEAISDLRNAVPDYPELAAQQTRVEAARRADAFNRYVVNGRAMLADGKYDEARDAYLAARRTLGPEDGARLDEVQKLLAEVDARRRFDETLTAARAAESAEKWDSAASLYDQARKLRPSSNLDSLYNRAQARALAAAAAAARAAGNVRAAFEKYQAALALDGTLDAAKRELESLDRIETWEPLVRQADEAFLAGRFAEALATYRQAGEMIPTRHIDERIRLCAFGRLMAAGDEAASRHEWAAAEAAYREAAQHGSPVDVDRKIEALHIDREYFVAVEEGDAAKQAEDYGRARTAYLRAKKVRPDAAIEEKLKDLEYARNLSGGDKAMQSKNYSLALMWFRKAQSVRDTTEVRARITAAQQQLSPGS